MSSLLKTETLLLQKYLSLIVVLRIMKHLLITLFLLVSISVLAQDLNSLKVKKTIAVSDTIQLDSVSINNSFFKLQTLSGKIIDSSFYRLNAQNATLILKNIDQDSVIVNYLKYPEFLTREYKQLDKSIIVKNNNTQKRLLQLRQPNTDKEFVPFDGLVTSGSISRGVTIGNNQNAVLNSELDLQITGQLNDKVSLRASIQDANIPLQESGYSQRLDEFDQVFVELFSKRWNVRAGDIDLQNKHSYFGDFTKRIQGLNVNINFGQEDNFTKAFLSGGVVRGQFTTSQFLAQEGNQGPYKLRGNKGELYVLIVSGSETVYVNGIQLQRGENQDYIIDYNAGEIIFNATFPITSEMRITVDYQYSERNYSRIVAYGGANYRSEKLQLNASVYSENDSKSNPLQQNLSNDQVAILSQAGDDISLMVAPSASAETYNENRILYKKEIVDGVETFVFSNNPDDDLFSVNFSLVGNNQGHYILANSQAISNIYQYVAPVNGVPQGNYEPVVQLVAPTRLQLAVVNGTYKPTQRTRINFEVSGSKNDLNLFSSLDDNNNDGFASHINAKQQLVKKDTTYQIDAFIDNDFIHKNFRNIQGIYNPEFNRDWNLDQAPSGRQIVLNYGNQALISSGLNFKLYKKGNANYTFEHLSFSGNYNGNRHSLNANFKFNTLDVISNTSYLTTNSNQTTSNFFRTFNRLVYTLKKKWIGAEVAMEDNIQEEKLTRNYTNLSQKFKSYHGFLGVGDSTKIFAEIGYKYRVNDSIRDNLLQKVNTSKTYYLNSRLIKNKTTNLSLYVNYRTLDQTDNTIEDEKSLNSRLLYNQRLFKNLLVFNTLYETNSGTLPRQDFTYVEVEAGQGAYIWIDYNGNNIQELEEFEVAQFQDQGKYVRVLLPNQVFIKTHQNKFSQTLTFNPIRWSSSSKKSLKFLSQFYNQTSYLLSQKQNRDGDVFNLNPFDVNEDNQLGLQLNFRNILFFNRGKQKYTTSYTYLQNRNKNELSIGIIENNLKSHQLQFTHKIKDSWLFNVLASLDKTKSDNKSLDGSASTIVNRNYNINGERFNPKLSYLFSDNNRLDVFYQYKTKDNTIGNLESLSQQNFGLSFALAGKKNNAINGEVNYFLNQFNGDANTPVAYIMLEGLQPGKNFTWSIIAQKKLTKYLDLNLNYFGRNSETSRTIHTGNIQLKAYF